MRRTPVRRRTGPLAALALSLCLGGGLLAAPSQAAPAAAPPTPSAAPTTAQGPDGAGPLGPAPSAARPVEAEHVRDARTPLDQRPPLSADRDALRRDYDAPATPDMLSPEQRRPSTRGRARAACDVGDFTGSTGAALVEKVRGAAPDCVNTLFNLTGADARGAFREEQMVTVADALRAGSADYPGDGSTGMPQIVLFLRAGYFVHWYNPDDVGEYGPALRSAIQGGLDAFFDSAHAGDVTDANGETLAEAVTLIDSAEENARYLPVVKRLLEGYDASYDDSWWMLNAVNNVYTVLFRGHQVPEFVSAVEEDPSILRTLSDFAAQHLDLLGGEQSYLTSNAGRELGHFLQHATLRPEVTSLARGLLQRSEITGRTAPLWVGVAEMTAAYDGANCATYGTCDLPERLTDAALPVRHACGPSIDIRAQEINAEQLAATCASLTGQDAFFHDIARDSGPVADDHNETIEVTAFDSSTDYQTYAGAIFGIDTNNGGMYLEGDPSVEGNKPRFIAYEAEWLRPDFAIWNLNHEYTHYLDGRFNMHGDFAAGVSTPTVWWIEGFAEYVSYSYRDLPYEEAAAEAGKHTYPLSTLFDTTYENADTTRVYRWGYLAVRYLLERHRDDVDTVLGHYRAGDWQAARQHLTRTIGGDYDADWDAWLTECAAGGCARTA
ncbi:collagenase [Streptomyces buecherae]|uniref:microbial collagenase n=1 Tax=Streptomyces buecherae TaxID=2763006 RepID=A0A7H8N5A3_9ACTN|nr:collagenase [Streptomyces buecherae]QKW49561.1 collagenase [Streptomyces buecherae]